MLEHGDRDRIFSEDRPRLKRRKLESESEKDSVVEKNETTSGTLQASHRASVSEDRDEFKCECRKIVQGAYAEENKGFEIVGYKGGGVSACCVLEADMYERSKEEEHSTRVAVKVFKSEERFRRQAREEIETLTRLRECKSVARLIDSFQVENSVCLVLELCSHTLQSLLWATGGFGDVPGMLKHIFIQLLEAVNHLHEFGYCHADLKPGNIGWIANTASIRLLDFGLAFEFKNGPRHLIETRGYRSPEARCWNTLRMKLMGKFEKDDNDDDDDDDNDDDDGGGDDGRERRKREREVVVGRLKPFLNEKIDAYAVGVIGCQMANSFHTPLALAPSPKNDRIYELAEEIKGELAFYESNTTTASSLFSPSTMDKQRYRAWVQSVLPKKKNSFMSTMTSILSGFLEFLPTERLDVKTGLNMLNKCGHLNMEKDKVDIWTVPTSSMVLVGIIQDTDSKDGIEDALWDVQERCSQYGPIVSVTASQLRPNSSTPPPLDAKTLNPIENFTQNFTSTAMNANTDAKNTTKLNTKDVKIDQSRGTPGTPGTSTPRRDTPLRSIPSETDSDRGNVDSDAGTKDANTNATESSGSTMNGTSDEGEEKPMGCVLVKFTEAADCSRAVGGMLKSTYEGRTITAAFTHTPD